MTESDGPAKEIAGALFKRAAEHGGDKLLEEASVLILYLLEERKHYGAMK